VEAGSESRALTCIKANVSIVPNNGFVIQRKVECRIGHRSPSIRNGRRESRGTVEGYLADSEQVRRANAESAIV
jgi:hypothetical protein